MCCPLPFFKHFKWFQTCKKYLQKALNKDFIYFQQLYKNIKNGEAELNKSLNSLNNST